MAIKNYAIIDHVGSIDEKDLKVYSKIYKDAKKAGFEKDKSLFTMKKICTLESPYAKEITKKMKYRVRYQKNPQMVYFICPTLDFKTECEVKRWHDRGIEVRIYETLGNAEYTYKDFFDTHQIDVDGKASINRRIAEIWAPAFGYGFSAPISRIQHDNNLENFIERTERKQFRINPELTNIDVNETHYTKPFTSDETFLEMNRCIALDSEIKEFRKYIDAYLTLTGCRIDTKVGATFGSVSGNTSALAEFLNPDYIICETCGRPMKVHTGDCECPHCLNRFSEDIVLTAYYEDSSDLED